MGIIYDFSFFRERRTAEQVAKRKAKFRTSDLLIQAQTIDKITLQIDNLLEVKARDEAMPDAVAMAAGRYAAMELFRKRGRAQTVAFFEDCIQTAEICDDIITQLDDELV